MDFVEVKKVSIIIDKEDLESAFRNALFKNAKELGLEMCDNCGTSNSADFFKIAELLAKVAIKQFKKAEVLK